MRAVRVLSSLVAASDGEPDVALAAPHGVNAGLVIEHPKEIGIGVLRTPRLAIVHVPAEVVARVDGVGAILVAVPCVGAHFGAVFVGVRAVNVGVADACEREVVEAALDGVAARRIKCAIVGHGEARRRAIGEGGVVGGAVRVVLHAAVHVAVAPALVATAWASMGAVRAHRILVALVGELDVVLAAADGVARGVCEKPLEAGCFVLRTPRHAVVLDSAKVVALVRNGGFGAVVITVTLTVNSEGAHWRGSHILTFPTRRHQTHGYGADLPESHLISAGTNSPRGAAFGVCSAEDCARAIRLQGELKPIRDRGSDIVLLPRF
mmetsp:Transcript_21604/g.43822  ORF Transcript_21604/g.43822 Transcript_21604/m.43822 type:complete len:322 (-) Transcript_21604:238-1203(-)